MTGPPRTSLGPFPHDTLGTHHHIAQRLLCPTPDIPSWFSHSLPTCLGAQAPLLSVLWVQPVWVSLRLACPNSCQHCRHGLAKAEECRTVTSLLLHTLLLLMQPNVTFPPLVTASHCCPIPSRMTSRMPKPFLSMLLLFSSVSPPHPMLSQLLFNSGAESYLYPYLWSFAWEGGACMRVSVGVFTHAFCYTKVTS